MKINSAVKYLNYKKLKLKALSSLFGLRLEKTLEKPIFFQKPYLISLIYTCLNIFISLVIYFTIVLIFPQIFKESNIVSYMLLVSVFILFLGFNQFKSDFFIHFKNDHFFNLLSNKQSEFIFKTVNFNTNEILFRYFIPLILPGYLHLIFFNKHYLIIFLLPLIFIFIKLILQFINVIYISLYALSKEYFLIKLLLYYFKAQFILTIYFLLILTTILFFNDFIKLKINNTSMIILIIFLLIINLILYSMKNIPNRIISQNYKRFIFIEGHKKINKKHDNKNSFIHKLISLGMINLDDKEKVIYQKDLKNILRNKTARISIIVIGIISTIVFFIIGLSIPLRKFNDNVVITFYFLLNSMITYVLVFFLLIHKHISSFSKEGYNHVIYQKVKINYYKVYKAKLFFNRFFVVVPFLPFFIILLFNIRNLEGVLLYLLAVLYFWGIINCVIKLDMLNDFFQPRFNGQIKNEKFVQQDYISNFASFIIFSYFLVPMIYDEFSHKNNALLIIIIILLTIIYILYFNLYRKSLILKKAKTINYGGIEIA